MRWFTVTMTCLICGEEERCLFPEPASEYGLECKCGYMQPVCLGDCTEIREAGAKEVYKYLGLEWQG